MTEAELLLTILDGAGRLSALSSAEQERALADLSLRANRVAVACGLSEAGAERLASKLVDALRAAAESSRPAPVLH